MSEEAKEAGEYLKKYLAAVPRKGIDVILHAHGVSADNVSILGGYNRGYWFDVKRA